MFQLRDELLPQDRIRAIQEELAGFFLDHIINKAGEYHVEIDIDMRCYGLSEILYCIYVASSVG